MTTSAAILAEVSRITRLAGPSVSDSRIWAQARANVAQLASHHASLRAANIRSNLTTIQAEAEFAAADLAAGW